MERTMNEPYQARFTGRHEAAWVVVHDGTRTYYENQRDAWEYAKRLARKHRGEAVLFGKNGAERERVSYIFRPGA